jgi:AcrR family transcriptional regulator
VTDLEAAGRESVGIADADGIEAVSLRRVAGTLGTGPTSLYRYIDSKDELFDLMVDAAIGEQKPPAPTRNWRADLRAIAHQYRAMTLRHPWLAMLPTTRPVLGPNSLDWLEAAHAAVDPLNLDPDAALAQIGTLLTFVRGHVVDELAESQAARQSGMNINTWLNKQSRYGDTIFTSGRYPRLTRVMADAELPHTADRFEHTFAYGLNLILTALQHHHDQREQQTGEETPRQPGESPPQAPSQHAD